MDFYCPELKLAIEADGYTHESPEAKIRDRERQSILEATGIMFLRFTDEEILGNVDKVVERIRDEIGSLNLSHQAGRY